MVSNHSCLKEFELGKILESLKNIECRFTEHVVESERKGGYRDRIIIMEQQYAPLDKKIDRIEKSYWFVGIIGGVIGGLFAQAAPEVMGWIIKLVIKN